MEKEKYTVSNVIELMNDSGLNLDEWYIDEFVKGVNHEWREHKKSISKYVEKENIDKLLCCMVCEHFEEDFKYYTHLEELEDMIIYEEDEEDEEDDEEEK